MKCRYCGGEIDLVARKCPHCDSTYTQEEIDRFRQGVEHVIETTVGRAEEIRLCKNANDHFVLGELGYAREEYRKIQLEFPRNYMGWFGEAKCITKNFTKVDLSASDMAMVDRLINNAIATADTQEQQNIRSQWTAYRNKCYHAEQQKREERQREEKERQQAEQQKKEKRQREEEERQQAEQARIRSQNLEKEKQEKKRQSEAACGIIIEVVFVVLMFIFQYMNFVDNSLEGFIAVNLIMLAFVLCVTLIHKSGNVVSGIFVPSYINALFAASIVIFSAFHVGGFVNGFLALVFFGVIESGVASLGFVIVKKILNVR